MGQPVSGRVPSNLPTRGVVPLAEASYRFASILQKHGIDYFQQASVLINDAELKRDLGTVPGDASGARLQYFWILAGSDELIKPLLLTQT